MFFVYTLLILLPTTLFWPPFLTFSIFLYKSEPTRIFLALSRICPYLQLVYALYPYILIQLINLCFIHAELIFNSYTYMCVNVNSISAVSHGTYINSYEAFQQAH